MAEKRPPLRKLPPVLRESRAAGEWVAGVTAESASRAFGVAAYNDDRRTFATWGHGRWWACEYPGGTIDRPDWFFELPPLPAPEGTDG